MHIKYDEMGFGHFEKMKEILEEDGYELGPFVGGISFCNFKVKW